MDEADISDERETAILEASIAVVRQAPPEARETGRCLWCGEPTETGRRWCCVECRDEWERKREKSIRKL